MCRSKPRDTAKPNCRIWQKLTVTLIQDFPTTQCPNLPRTLDAELKSHCRGMAPDFDFRKMSFVVEASGSLHNEQLEQAQSRTANALKKSLGAAWELFQTNLQSDQVMRDKFLNSCSGDESRQRAAIIDSLEVTGFQVMEIEWFK